jgi:hypothetical protein
MTQNWTKALIAAMIWSCLLGATACKKKDSEQSEQSAGSGSAATAAASKDLADSVEPTGVTWKRIDLPFGSLELPIDPGWNLVGTQVEGKDGIVITMQVQDGITPDLIDEYLASYDEVQKRDAPKYAGTSSTKGTVSGAVAARVEGRFDNDIAFVTRDFLLFTKNKVVVIGGRVPEASAGVLPGIIDHAVRTLQIK